MRTRVFKNWVTSLMGLFAALLMVAGIMWPDQVDPDTQEVLKTAMQGILVGIGSVIAVVTTWFAKD